MQNAPSAWSARSRDGPVGPYHADLNDLSTGSCLGQLIMLKKLEREIIASSIDASLVEADYKEAQHDMGWEKKSENMQFSFRSSLIKLVRSRGRLARAETLVLAVEKAPISEVY